MPTKEELRAKARQLRALLSQVESIPGVSSENEREAARKRAVRRASRVVEIPSCADPARRKRLERDCEKWLRWYFGDIFTRPFTRQQRVMIAAILQALKDGGDQAIAASRGEGKSTLAECVLIFCALTGKIRFAILFAGTGEDAAKSLEAIKQRLEESERLAADYPEVCVPIQALEGVPQKAHSMICSGKHASGEPFATSCRFKWCGKEIFLPRVPGSIAAGVVIATRGLDGRVRGVKVGGKSLRPDVALIDDPDTDETVNNPDQGKKLEKKIDRNIAGLGGQDRRVARVMLTTIQRRGCVSDRFTDPKIKPSWRGKRFRFLEKPPARTDLWDEFVALQIVDWQNDGEGRPTANAVAFYRNNRRLMDAGAVVGNPHRRPGGELSALQFYFSEVARIGPESVATEYDNDPPEESGPIESGITAYKVQRKVSDFKRQIVPPLATVLIHAFDVRKIALHWVVRAYAPDASYWTIDYGVHEVHGTTYGTDEGLDVAIQRAILARIEAAKQTDYLRGDGELVPIDLHLVDARWRTAAVYAACAEAGLGVMPIMGFGKSAGCVAANFSDVQRRSVDRKPGDGWFLTRKGTLWLVCSDADRWKAWEHDRWMTAPGKPGCAQLFGEAGPADRMSADEKGHHSYARHIVSEVEVEELVKGVLKRHWKTKSDNNHWLDASCYANVGANIKGIRLPLGTTAKPTKRIPGQAAASPAAERPSLAELAQRAGQ